MKKNLILLLAALAFTSCTANNTNEQNNNNNNNNKINNNNNINNNINNNDDPVTEITPNSEDTTENIDDVFSKEEFFDCSVLRFRTNKELVRCEYFGIENQDTMIFKDETTFAPLKDKIVNLYTEYDSHNSVPEIDFSKYDIVVTALYGDEYASSFELTSIGRSDNKIIEYVNLVSGAPLDNNLTTFFWLRVSKDEKASVRVSINQEILEKKPIIYFYPEHAMDLDIKFENEENLLTTYPKYNDGWHIHLKEDGYFTMDDSDREYYALYYDAKSNFKCSFDEGFFVTKDNAISFLEEKMDYMGFTNRETNEFIMYWLPILENNGKSLVYFEQTEMRNLECPLHFSQNPDTLIRTNIHIKKVNENVEIKEQELTYCDRRGFTVVEWGGIAY